MTRAELLGTAEFNIEDNTLRWTPGARLGPEEYARTKAAGFKFWGSLEAWVATWTPEREDFLLEFVEAIEHEADPDDATGRIERFTSRAAAEGRADGRRKTATSIVGQIPMGQPVLVGHHSEGRHRRALERSDQNMRKAFEESKKAEYWQSRARGSERCARQKSHPGVIQRRIRTLETDLRKVERGLDASRPGTSTAPVWSYDLGREYTPGELAELKGQAQVRAERWVEHLSLSLAFERTRLEALTGGQAVFSGEVVLCRGTRSEVVRVGGKKIRIKILDGGAVGMSLLETPDRLKKIEAVAGE